MTVDQDSRRRRTSAGRTSSARSRRKLCGLKPRRSRVAGGCVATNRKSRNAAGRSAKSNRRQPPRQGRAEADVLLQHVFGTIEGELKKLDSHKGASSQDRERARGRYRKWSTVWRKPSRCNARLPKPTPRGARPRIRKQLAHAEDLRRAIAERLERLHSKRDARKAI